MIDTSKNKGQFTPYQLGAMHMVDNVAFEPQRTNNFELQIDFARQTGTGANYTTPMGGVTYAPDKMQQTVLLSVASVGDLQQSVEAIAVNYGNNAIKFAGKPQLNSLSVSVNDFIGLETERMLEAWSREVYDKATQKVGQAINYKKRAYLIEYSPDGEVAKAWQLEGCWPGSITYGGYSQDGGNIRQISFDLNVDFAIPLDSK